jgi:hypothetical protein
VCANSDDAAQLKKENRNVVPSASVKEAMKRLKRGSRVTGLIESSFALLRQGENEGGFELVTPERKTETVYVLIRARMDAAELRSVLDQRGIRVMWGSEFGLSDQYIRLETLEPRNIRVFVETVNGAAQGKTVALTSKMAGS